jgi:hypothetical protein
VNASVAKEAEPIAVRPVRNALVAGNLSHRSIDVVNVKGKENSVPAVNAARVQDRSTFHARDVADPVFILGVYDCVFVASNQIVKQIIEFKA